MRRAPDGEADASGAVPRSSVGPKIAVTGRPTAAARCMAPESLETKARQRVIRPTSERQVGLADEVDDGADRRRSAGWRHGRRGCRRGPRRRRAARAAGAPRARTARAATASRRRRPRPAPCRPARPRPSTPCLRQQRRRPHPHLVRHDEPRRLAAGWHAERRDERGVVLGLVHAPARLPDRPGQQRRPPVGRVSPSLRDCRPARGPRAAERVRQEDGHIRANAGQRLGVGPPRRDAPPPSPGLERHHVVDARHHPEERRPPTAARPRRDAPRRW